VRGTRAIAGDVLEVLGVLGALEDAAGMSNEYVRHGTRTLLAAVDVSTGKATTWVQLNIARGVPLCPDGILRGATSGTTRLDVDLRDNLFYVLVSAIVFGDTPASSLPDCLTWYSGDNFARAGSAFLRTYKSRATNAFVPLVIATEADLMRHFPDRSLFKSEGDHYGKIFDFGKLPLNRIAPDELPADLDPGIESPATKTLEHFADRAEKK
jgi:hypothetical protein